MFWVACPCYLEKKRIMMKRTPSRNHRSKGIKLKHVLQIILLLGICFWLIYQIKHSHDKKKEFDENDAKESVRMQNADQIPKLGRKDLQPLKDDRTQTEQDEEKEEDENNLDDEGNAHEQDEQEEEASKHETGDNLDKQEFKERDDDDDDDEEEESKHRAAEQEEEENKSEESENDGRGGWDEETEENDQEKPEVTIDLEELMDEDRERERRESDENENEIGEDEEKDSAVDNESTHEAREEHYMADDASSAVAHDAQTTNIESVVLNAGNSNKNSEMSVMKQEKKPNYTEESGTIQSDSGKITADELESGNVSNATGKESGNTILLNSVDDSNVNITATANSEGHLEVSSNHSVVITEAINNSTGDGINKPGSSEQKKTVILSESGSFQNATVDMTANTGVKNGKTEESEQSYKDGEDNLPVTNSTVSMKTGIAGESSDSGVGQLGKTVNHVASNETQNGSINSDAKGNVDASVDEKSKAHYEIAATNVVQNSSDAKGNNDAGKDEKSMDDTQLDSTNRTSDSASVNGGASDLVEQDAIDASDSHIHKDVTEVRTNLDTLPDIRDDETNIFDEHALPDIKNEGNILDETAAE